MAEEEKSITIAAFKPVAFGKVCGVLFAIIGLVLAASSYFGIKLPSLPGVGDPGVLAIIVYPVFFGVAGLIGGAIFAFVYNMISDLLGGVEIETD